MYERDPLDPIHVNQVLISCNGWNDVPTLECHREECMVDYLRTKGGAVAKVYWSMTIPFFTPEQAIRARNQHVRESNQ